MPTSVWDLPRNDIAACRLFWLEREVSGEEFRVMLRLQDDPTQLIVAAKLWKKRAGKSKRA